MKTYRLSSAIVLLAKHGFPHICISEFYLRDNRMVTLHQSWTPNGKEKVDVRLALGKYKGNVIGQIYREKFTF